MQRVQAQVHDISSDIHHLQDQIKILNQQYNIRQYHSGNSDSYHNTDFNKFPILQPNKLKSHAQNFKKNLESIRLELDNPVSL
eukprot:7744454-Ditylum_brightwellii.AAC.2